MTELCAACEEPLLVDVGVDSDVEDSKKVAHQDSILDDVELSCHCHFHWECFLEADTITECSNCSKDISSLSASGQQQVLCTVRNEGGIQEAFDILPTATEEAYLRAYPEERRGHAFLEFCREGDIDAILHLVRDDIDDEDEMELQSESIDILRYQGTFEGIDGSGLHVAIRHKQEEVAWLMLALASNLDWTKFPKAVLDAMQTLGLSKEDRKPNPDIRASTDNNGRTPLEVAKETGAPWAHWISSGLLTP